MHVTQTLQSSSTEHLTCTSQLCCCSSSRHLSTSSIPVSSYNNHQQTVATDNQNQPPSAPASDFHELMQKWHFIPVFDTFHMGSNKHIRGHTGDSFCGSNDPTNSDKALKEVVVLRIRLQYHQVHLTVLQQHNIQYMAINTKYIKYIRLIHKNESKHSEMGPNETKPNPGPKETCIR